jgi:hypothetical protein
LYHPLVGRAPIDSNSSNEIFWGKSKFSIKNGYQYLIKDSKILMLQFMGLNLAWRLFSKGERFLLDLGPRKYTNNKKLVEERYCWSL